MWGSFTPWVSWASLAEEAEENYYTALHPFTWLFLPFCFLLWHYFLSLAGSDGDVCIWLSIKQFWWQHFARLFHFLWPCDHVVWNKDSLFLPQLATLTLKSDVHVVNLCMYIYMYRVHVGYRISIIQRVKESAAMFLEVSKNMLIEMQTDWIYKIKTWTSCQEEASTTESDDCGPQDWERSPTAKMKGYNTVEAWE